MTESVPSYTHGTLKDYYKDTSTWKKNDKRFKEMSAWDPGDYIKITLIFMATVLILAGATAYVGQTMRHTMGAGGYYTLVTFLAASTAVVLGLFIYYCTQCPEWRRYDISERKGLEEYFNKPLSNFELLTVVQHDLDPAKLPDDLKPFQKKKASQ